MTRTSTIVDPALATLRGPERYCLPKGYAEHRVNFTFDANRPAGESYWSPKRIADCAKWQHYVYRWAAKLIKARGVKSVLDVGCGIGTKLKLHVEPLCTDVTGVDQGPALEIARSVGVRAQLEEMDLERPKCAPGRSWDMLICADVLEHLLDPDPLVAWMHEACHAGTVVIFSTPERTRERGRACNASPKREHVREWSDTEFARYLTSRGMLVERQRLMPNDDRPLAGLHAGERDFRRQLTDRSPLACQALLCRSLFAAAKPAEAA